MGGYAMSGHPTRSRAATQGEAGPLASIYAFILSCHGRNPPASAGTRSADAKCRANHPARKDGDSSKDGTTGR